MQLRITLYRFLPLLRLAFLALTFHVTHARVDCEDRKHERENLDARSCFLKPQLCLCRSRSNTLVVETQQRSSLCEDVQPRHVTFMARALR